MSAPSEEVLAGGTAQDFGEERLMEENHKSISPETFRKKVSTLKAEYALRGYALHELADGSLLACRWDRTRSLANVEAAEIFLRQIGGAA